MKRQLNKVASLLAVMLLVFSLAGCRKFQTPIIETIAPNESAVLIQLYGDNTNQEQAKSEQFYKENLVYNKEITLGQRWVKTGRTILFFQQGDYRPTESLIKVSRVPVSREWVNGTDGSTALNQGFDVESKDSIGFAFGVVVTAQVEERNIAKFLYKYSSRQMEIIMDEEIRNHIQAVLSEVATKYTLGEIAEMKLVAISELEKQVVPYFAEKGITITNIGFKGGLWYEDKAIQIAFNDVIVKQKAEVAQLAENIRLETEAATIRQIGIDDANAYAEQARIKESVWETYAKMEEIEIRKMYVSALLEHGLPNTLVTGEGSSLILDING